MPERIILSTGAWELVLRKKRQEVDIKIKPRKKQDINPFLPKEKPFSLPVIPDRLQGELVNVAGFVSSSLRQENPDIFQEVDTTNPDLISERNPQDSLKVLLSVKGINLENLSLRIVKDFGAGGMTVAERINLAEKVENILETISPKD